MSGIWLCCCLLSAAILVNSAAVKVPRRRPNPKVPTEVGKIVGGVAVSITEYPYQLSLRVSGTHICGASVISTTWALTAAHCSGSEVVTMTLRAGSTDRTTGGHIRRVNLKVLHPLYNSSTYDYDIAVLRVWRSFKYSSSVAPVLLPAPNSVIFPNSNATVSGWGTQTAGTTDLPTNLQAVSLPIVSLQYCQTAYGEAYITPRMICAGFPEGGKDSCQGDSGGPMVVVIGGTKRLVGVVSWGNSCALPGSPGVYASVGFLRAWIASTTGV